MTIFKTKDLLKNNGFVSSHSDYLTSNKLESSNKLSPLTRVFYSAVNSPEKAWNERKYVKSLALHTIRAVSFLIMLPTVAIALALSVMLFALLIIFIVPPSAIAYLALKQALKKYKVE